MPQAPTPPNVVYMMYKKSSIYVGAHVLIIWYCANEQFLNTSSSFREGIKKKNSGIFHLGGWVGSAVDRFSVNSYFFFEKNMSLKHWIVPKDHFKTHLFFSIFGWGDPSPLES